MKVLLQVMGSIALLAMAWLAGEAAYTMRQLRPHLEVTLENVDRTVIIAGAAATHLEKASGTWEQSSKQQVVNSNKILMQSGNTVKTLNAFIAGLDANMNKSLLPLAAKALEQQNTALLESQRLLQENLAQSQKTLADADAQINSPDIKIAMDNFAASSANLANATADGAATMKDVRVAVDKEVQTLLAPVNKAKMVILFTAQLIGRLYGF